MAYDTWLTVIQAAMLSLLFLPVINNPVVSNIILVGQALFMVEVLLFYDDRKPWYTRAISSGLMIFAVVAAFSKWFSTGWIAHAATLGVSAAVVATLMWCNALVVSRQANSASSFSNGGASGNGQEGQPSTQEEPGEGQETSYSHLRHAKQH